MVVALVAMYFYHRQTNDPIERGQQINAEAWEASYLERGATPPPSGPREGYWGKRLGPNVRDERLGWYTAAVSIPGLVEIETDGTQAWLPAKPARRRLLIVGASVAFGAYASSIDKSYFAVLGRELERQGLPTEIRVFAAGAWKSTQEIAALELELSRRKPDLVVCLSGLNDLTIGGTAQTLFTQPVVLLDGTTASHDYHAGDFQDRVQLFLKNMRQAAVSCQTAGCELVVALQPSLAEQSHRTPIEEELLRGALGSRGWHQRDFDQSYASLRSGLSKMQGKTVHFVDYSRLFAEQTATTFSDLWHFSDYGHETLGLRLAQDVLPLLRDSRAPPREE